MGEMELRYLKSLARQYPSIASAATEIINLRAILSLPKRLRCGQAQDRAGIRHDLWQGGKEKSGGVDLLSGAKARGGHAP